MGECCCCERNSASLSRSSVIWNELGARDALATNTSHKTECPLLHNQSTTRDIISTFRSTAETQRYKARECTNAPQEICSRPEEALRHSLLPGSSAIERYNAKAWHQITSIQSLQIGITNLLTADVVR
jgi:hypothetical protein